MYQVQNTRLQLLGIQDVWLIWSQYRKNSKLIEMDAAEKEHKVEMDSMEEEEEVEKDETDRTRG